jgi:hypothetical protein
LYNGLVPDQPTWLQRVPAILAQLEPDDAPPFLDRAAIESLFRLSRRQAIRLLSVCGGYQVGRTFVVPRAALLDFIHARVGGDKVEFAVRRKARIIDQLNDGRRRAASERIALRAPSPFQIVSLPDGVRLLPGLLEVQFDSPVQLLEKLFALAQAVHADFEAFDRAASDPEIHSAVSTAE